MASAAASTPEATALVHPDAGLVACEVYENGICSLLSALVPEGGEATAPLLPNLLIWDDDARLLLRRIPPGSLGRLFLMFPDPWPKIRHAKRRFVHPDNVALAARALREGAEWRIASDDPTYQAWTASVLANQPWFTVPAPATERPDGWPPHAIRGKGPPRRPLPPLVDCDADRRNSVVTQSRQRRALAC